MKYVTVLLLSAILLWCCGDSENSRRYTIKSGIVTYRTSIDTKSVYYFDDFGSKEAYLLEISGAVLKTIYISDEAYSLIKWGNVFDEKVTRYTPSEIPERYQGIWEFLRDNNHKKNDYQEIGTDIMLGKQVRGYTFTRMARTMSDFNFTEKAMAVEIWHYEGIPFAIKDRDTKVFMHQVMSAEFNIPLPDEVFALPANVTFEERKLPIDE